MSLMTRIGSSSALSNNPLDLVVCIDRSDSMGYGRRQSKLDEVKHLVIELVNTLSSEDRVAITTFDNMANIHVPLTLKSQLKNLRAAIDRISERGNTSLVRGIKISQEAFDLEAGKVRRIIVLSDGRTNLSFNGEGGFEGSISVEKELADACMNFERLGISVVAIVIGTDAFVMPLKNITDTVRGCLILDELKDFSQLIKTLHSETILLPISFKSPLLERRLDVASIPQELPTGQPAWSLESLNEHVAVVSKEISSIYLSASQAIVANPLNQRFARVALMSIEDDSLKSYCERLPKIAERVKAGEVILLDQSYRLELNLDKDDIVDLRISP